MRLCNVAALLFMLALFISAHDAHRCEIEEPSELLNEEIVATILMQKHMRLERTNDSIAQRIADATSALSHEARAETALRQTVVVEQAGDPKYDPEETAQGGARRPVLQDSIALEELPGFGAAVVTNQSTSARRGLKGKLLSFAHLLQKRGTKEAEGGNSKSQLLGSTGYMRTLLVSGHLALVQLAGFNVVTPIIIVLLVLIGFVLVQGVLSQRHDRQYDTGPAAAMLPYSENKSFATSPLQDSRVPLAANRLAINTSASPIPTAVQPKSALGALGGFMAASLDLSATFSGGSASSLPLPQEETKTPTWSMSQVISHGDLCPFMQVREAEGQQLILEGLLRPGRQQSSLQVKRVTPDAREEMVMHATLSEQGINDGVSIELPLLSTGPAPKPIAFLDTSAAGRGGRILVYQCINGRFNRNGLFAVAQFEPDGICTIRRPGMTEKDAGEVMLCMLSGGYNCDVGNITDAKGILRATVTSRGLRENTRKLHIAQGVDAVMVIAALICNVKLSS